MFPYAALVTEPDAAEAVNEETIPDPTDDEPAVEDEPVLDVDASLNNDEDTPTADQTLRYYGVDFDVEGLVRRFGRKDLLVPSFDPEAELDGIEGFQRRFVWPKKQMDRFVESLLLGYPVPGVFLVEQASRRFLILDGQQRIRTLHAFYEGVYGTEGQQKVFRLDNVRSSLRGLTYKTLPDPDKRLLDSTILQATVVVPQKDGLESVYRVFERINSSGIKLQPQEIRVALYSGKLIHLLRRMNAIESWRDLFGAAHSRLKDHELILRYLALLESAEVLRKFDWDRDRALQDAADERVLVYRPAMTTFLNSYLGRHRNLEGLDADSIQSEFSAITKLLSEAGGRSILRFSGSQVNAAHADAVLVGAALAVRDGVELTASGVRSTLDMLVASPGYRAAVVESTSHIDSVIDRLRLSFEAFSTRGHG